MSTDNQRLNDLLESLSDGEFTIPPAAFNDKDMEQHILQTDWLVNKVRNSNIYAQNLYAAICNNAFVQIDNTWAMLQQDYWSASWRSAGGIIARITGEGDYLDWYGCGIMSDNTQPPLTPTGYVPESVITDEIKNDLRSIGWMAVK